MLRQRQCKKDTDIVELEEVKYHSKDKGYNYYRVTAYFIVFVISFVSRYIWLDFPNCVLFDETHFFRMSNRYLHGSHYFDIHPPLGKLILSIIAYLSGYLPNIDSNLSIGYLYEDNQYIWLRSFIALCGSLLPLVIFRISEKFGNTLLSSFLISLMICFENSLQTISRAILLDSILYLSMMISLLFALNMWESLSLSKYKYWMFVILCGLFMGISISIKHTGFGIVGLIGTIHIIIFIKKGFEYSFKYSFLGTIHRSLYSDEFKSGILMICLICFVYLISFWIHFELITKTGKDDDIMSTVFQSQLIGNKKYNENIPSPSFFRNFIELNRKMLLISSQSNFEHYHASEWYHWPFMYLGVVYFWKDLPNGNHQLIYLFGNPIIFWVVCISIVFGICIGLFSSKRNTILICLYGYFINYLPYIKISRTKFMYHYHPALLFGIFLTGTLIDIIKHKTTRYIITYILISIIACSYLYFSAYSYGFELSSEQHDQMRWFPSIFPRW